MQLNLLGQFDSLTYPALLINSKDECVWCNKKFYQLHKTASADAKEKLLKSITADVIPQILKSKEYLISHVKKEYFFSVIESPVEFEDEPFTLLSFFDISRRKELMQEISEKQKMFETLSDSLPEGIVLSASEIVYTNPAFEKLIGYSGRELKRKKFLDLFPQSTRNGFKERGKSDYRAELRLKKGNSLWVRVKTQPLRLQGELYFLSIVTDVTREDEEEKKLTRLAYFDALTGIYNRRKFDELLTVEYSRAKRYKRDLSALFFDIDHFKKVNDIFGHDIGDSVLKNMTEVVSKHIRETDFFARWGGEEFIILLPETSVDNAALLAEHIRNGVQKNRFEIVENVTISMGVTSLKGNERIQTFVKRLDSALYKAKRDGRNTIAIM